MRCSQESDGAIHNPIAKPFAVISAAIAGVIMIPILLFRGKKNNDDIT
jgi:hypothetical protein